MDRIQKQGMVAEQLVQTETDQIVLGKKSFESLVSTPTSTLPNSPSPGQIAFDSTDNKFKGYDGAEWQEVSFTLRGDSGLVAAGNNLRIDIKTTTESSTSIGSDVFLMETDNGLKRITRDNLLASVAGGTQLRGASNPKSTDPTPITSLTINGDPENATISQGTAPTTSGPSANGFTYLVILDPGDRQTGVTIRMGGTAGTPKDFLVFDQDQLQWVGNQFVHLETGDAVISVHGRTGVVTSADGDYTGSQITNVPKGQITAVTTQAAINQIDDQLTDIRDGNIGVGNADTLDGLDSTDFMQLTGNQVIQGDKTFTDVIGVNGLVEGSDTLPLLRVLDGNSTTVGAGSREYVTLAAQNPPRWLKQDGSFGKIWTEANDGSGSGLDADLLDGLNSDEFVRTTTNQTVAGDKTLTGTNVHTGANDFRAPTTIDFSNYTNASGFTINYPSGTGGWARHIRMDNTASSDHYFNIGLLGSSETYTYAYLGYGDYGAANNLRIYPDGNLKVGSSKVWHQGNDGAGSGLDADLLDGLHASSFLRKDTSDTLNGKLTVNSRTVAKGGTTSNDYNSGQLEMYGNGSSVYPNIGFHQPGKFAGSLQLRAGGDFRFYAQGGSSYGVVRAATFYGALSGNASTATWADKVDVNSGNTSGSWYDIVWHSGDTVYSSTGVEIQGSTNSIKSNRHYFAGTSYYLREATGSYGTVASYGRKGSWGGYSIEGRAVFMHDGSATSGIYDDVNNKWMALFKHGGATTIHYNGSSKLATASGGVKVTGTLTCSGGGINAQGEIHGDGGVYGETNVRLDRLTSKGTRTSGGTWTITGLVSNRPLYIFANTTSTGGKLAEFRATSGAYSNKSYRVRVGYSNTPAYADYSLILYPTSSTVKLSFGTFNSGLTLYAKQ